MINYTWKILETFADGENLTKVKFLLKAQDESNIVETEGYHQFSEGIVYKPFAEIKESDLIDWLNTDTTKDSINAIKLNLENQLKVCESEQKVDLPWLADTFTPGQ